MGLGGRPSTPKPKPPPPAPPPDYAEQMARLARQRRALELSRTGRRAFRLDLPGMYVAPSYALRIPGE